jgi:hypothetical protein
MSVFLYKEEELMNAIYPSLLFRRFSSYFICKYGSRSKISIKKLIVWPDLAINKIYLNFYPLFKKYL